MDKIEDVQATPVREIKNVPYSLDEMLEVLESIKTGGPGEVSLPEIFILVLKEIKSLKEKKKGK